MRFRLALVRPVAAGDPQDSAQKSQVLFSVYPAILPTLLLFCHTRLDKTSKSPFERHPTLYFPNGDIVLSASIDSGRDSSDAPPKTQLFRVHKFLVTHHSAMFANMFSDADPGSGESYDGVPMVELQGDKAQDLALLLNYLYNTT